MSTATLPPPDPQVLASAGEIVAGLTELLGPTA
jgi:hypothetical protein